MTDRELLELAARATGIKIHSFQSGKINGTIDGLKNFHWNPLTDDGDALRLAVKLGLVVWDWKQYQKAMAEVRHGPARGEYWADVGNDPLAATRRAIVRAAAEIGKAMP